MSTYKPPYTITSTILAQVSEISELISDIKHIEAKKITPKLRKKNLVRSITGSLHIKGWILGSAIRSNKEKRRKGV